MVPECNGRICLKKALFSGCFQSRGKNLAMMRQLIFINIRKPYSQILHNTWKNRENIRSLQGVAGANKILTFKMTGWPARIKKITSLII